MPARPPFTATAALFLLAALAPAQVQWTISSRTENGAELIHATAHNAGPQPAPLGRYQLHRTVRHLSPASESP